MEIFKDKEDFLLVTSPFLFKRCLTNNFCELAYFERFIEKKQLFYTISDENLYIFVNKIFYFFLYFNIFNINANLNFSYEKPVVTEFIYKDGNKSYGDIFYKKFELLLTRNRYYVSSDKFLYAANILSDNMEIYFPQIYDASDVHSFLYNSFDIYTGCLPDIEALYEFISRKNIICLKKNGVLIGILHFKIKKKTACIEHIAVDVDQRGKGYAGLLINFMYGSLKYVCDRFELWVGERNLSAQKLYKKSGYSFDGMKTDVFNLTNKKSDRDN